MTTENREPKPIEPAREMRDVLSAFADLIAAVTDAYVCPAEDLAPRDRWSRLSIAHQRAEAFLFVLDFPVPDAASRIAKRADGS